MHTGSAEHQLMRARAPCTRSLEVLGRCLRDDAARGCPPSPTSRCRSGGRAMSLVDVEPLAQGRRRIAGVERHLVDERVREACGSARAVA